MAEVTDKNHAALIVFFPVGLVLVWMSKWKMVTKVSVTALLALLVKLSVAASHGSQPSTQTAQTMVPATAAPSSDIVNAGSYCRLLVLSASQPPVSR